MKKFIAFGILVIVSANSQFISSEEKQITQENRVDELLKNVEEELIKQLEVEFCKLSSEDKLKYYNFLKDSELLNQKMNKIKSDTICSDEVINQEINKLNNEFNAVYTSSWLFGQSMKNFDSVCNQIGSVRKLRIDKDVNNTRSDEYIKESEKYKQRKLEMLERNLN